ncbi:LppA family lipoprotein [Gordonia sp. PKS22-38]|uniref:LppA family lipoprotein n=1 Tax=Gordonia prachuapensis TaxID=3115651 RepID=A0ABU7MW73_9ACTN|nr:LppA family lipoprotein [Gordonia sp. PKS22-38]
MNEATFSGGDTEVPQERIDELDAELRAMPSLEATVDEYRQMGDSITEQITRIAPTVVWTPDPQHGDNLNTCSGDWLPTAGRQIQLRRWTSAAPIPDAAWGQALEVARAAAAEKGITVETTNRDRPGDHSVAFTNAAGAKVNLGSKVAAVLSVRTPCRLPEHGDSSAPPES